MANEQVEQDDGSPHAKRRKLAKNSVAPDATTEVNTIEALRRLVIFEQDAEPQIKQSQTSRVGIITQLISASETQALRSFLNTIKNDRDHQAQQTKQALLLQLCQEHMNPDTAANTSAFSGLIQSWHSAVQANSEALCSSIAATIALLLKVISSKIDFREYGMSLCQELLSDDNLRLLNRSLTAHRAKEHLIDPCLRLLTEIVQFDGGSAARIIFRQKDTTFRRLDIFLSHRKQGDEIDRDRRRPSLRESALHYLLANLRLQRPMAKTCILSNTRIRRSLLQNIAQDPPWMIHKILGVLRKDVLEDVALAQSTKDQFLDEGTLTSLASLYDHNGMREKNSDLSVKESIHSFMLLACVPSAHARLRNAATCLSSETGASSEEVGEGIAEVTKLNRRVANLLPNLRPHADVLQRNLLLGVFQVDPSSIDEYFSRKSNFAFDPKLSATWVGYATFLLATIQLPVQKALLQGDLLRPGLVEEIYHAVLPQPLTKKTLTRCLNQSSQLVTFLTTSILNAVMNKVKVIMHMLDEEQAGKHIFELKRDLVVELAIRCPDMKCVITQYRTCREGNSVLKESISRLLAAYYQIIPDAALQETFDIATAVSDDLDINEQDHVEGRDYFSRKLNLDHILDIALMSPNMKWWRTPGIANPGNQIEGIRLSPFTKLLKAYVSQEGHRHSLQIGQILSTVAQANAFLTAPNRTGSLDMLYLSLRGLGRQDDEEVYAFLDNCIERLVKRPVVYYELAAQLSQDCINVSPRAGVDLLLIALVEQWPHLSQSKPSFVIIDVATWLSSYMRIIGSAVEDHSILLVLRAKLTASSSNQRCRLLFEGGQKQHDDSDFCERLLPRSNLPKVLQNHDATEAMQAGEKGLDPSLIPLGPQLEAEDHPELSRWAHEDIQDAVAEGMVGSLVLCLCSQELSIRRESLSQIRLLLARLDVRNVLLARWTALIENRHLITRSGSKYIPSLERYVRQQKISKYRNLYRILREFWLRDCCWFSLIQHISCTSKPANSSVKGRYGV